MPPDTASIPTRPEPPANRGGILAIVLVYAMFAACWILLSDKLVQIIFNDPKQIILASMLKGWLFVGVTSLLFYGLMLRWIGGDKTSKAHSASSHGLGLPFISLAVIIVMFTGTGILHTFKHQKEEAIGRLQADADIKALQITDWLKERQADADFTQTSDFFTEQYRRWQESGDQHSGERLQTQLEQLGRNHGFGAVILLDPKGKKLWGNDKTPLVLAQPLQTAAQLASAERTVRRAGPYRDAAANMYLDFIVPLTIISGSPPLVILHVDLTDRLSSILQTWPIPGAKGETVLFQRNGDQVLFLNKLKHRENTETKLPVPMTMEKLLNGEVSPGSPIEGLDYHGVPIIGVVRSIAGTDWFLMTKLNLPELYAEVVGDVAWTGFVGLLALFMTGAGFYLLRQAEQLAQAKALQQSQTERLRALHLLAAIADSSDDAIFAKDMDGRYLLFNRAASLFVGKSSEDLLGHDDLAIFPPEQAERLMAVDRRVSAENRTITQEERLNTLQGETEFLTTKGPLYDNEGNMIGIFGISRNITERKAAEAELIQRNDELERFNRTMIGRELDMIALKQQVNELSIRLGQEPPYPLAFLNTHPVPPKGNEAP
ncbi:MAG: PAS domain-containing protein [Methylobacter sp.]|nr:PAS domain-containing protein [Methylobacter sp.]